MLCVGFLFSLINQLRSGSYELSRGVSPRVSFSKRLSRVSGDRVLMARFIKYKKYVPEPASEMSLEDLLKALSDYLLQSGFQQQYMDSYNLDDAEQTLDDLRQAIADALLNSDMLDEQMREQIENMSVDQLEQLIDQLIERMEQEDYITVDQPHDPSRSSTAGGQVGDAQSQARFEITDKGLDFLASARCATYLALSASPALDATIHATRRPVSKPAAPPRPTNLATPSTSTSRRHSPTRFSAKGWGCR